MGLLCPKSCHRKILFQRSSRCLQMSQMKRSVQQFSSEICPVFCKFICVQPLMAASCFGSVIRICVIILDLSVKYDLYFLQYTLHGSDFFLLLCVNSSRNSEHVTVCLPELTVAYKEICWLSLVNACK